MRGLESTHEPPSSIEKREVKNTYISIWSAREAERHALLVRGAALPPFVCGRNDCLEGRRREDERPHKHGTALWVQFVHKLGRDAEVAATPTHAPEQVWVLVLVGGELLPISGHKRRLSKETSCVQLHA